MVLFCPGVLEGVFGDILIAGVATEGSNVLNDNGVRP